MSELELTCSDCEAIMYEELCYDNDKNACCWCRDVSISQVCEDCKEDINRGI